MKEGIETKKIQLTPCNTMSVSFPGARKYCQKFQSVSLEQELSINSSELFRESPCTILIFYKIKNLHHMAAY